MSASNIVLHQWEISPFCQKVARALRHKQLAFDTVNYNGLLAAKAARLSKVGKLPVLDINGQRLQDSTRIARYLDEHFPERPLYPTNQQQRAMVEVWEDWSDELLYWYEVYFRVQYAESFDEASKLAVEGRPALERLPTKLALRAALRLQLYSQGLGRMARADVEAEFLRHLDRLESVLSAAPWLVGENKTIADIAVGSQLLEIRRTSKRMGPELERRARVTEWLGRVEV